MGNEGERLNLIFGERIKGECLGDKKRIFGKEKKRTFGLLDPEKLIKENQREKKRKEKKREQNPKQKQYYFD